MTPIVVIVLCFLLSFWLCVLSNVCLCLSDSGQLNGQMAKLITWSTAPKVTLEMMELFRVWGLMVVRVKSVHGGNRMQHPQPGVGLDGQLRRKAPQDLC